MDIIDIGIYLSYLLFIIALGAAIVLPLVNAIKSPSTFVKSLAGVGALVVVFGISFALANDEVSPKAASLGIDATGSKLIGAGLTMLLFVFIAAAIGVIYSEINKAFK